jgi:hypothetical protein
MILLLTACGSPAVDDNLDTDDIKLPERAPPMPSASATSTATTGIQPPPPSSFTLSVSLTGGGAGAITSTPAGLTCTGTTCKGTFAKGTGVTLAAAPAGGTVFSGWSGGCTGTTSCTAKVDKDLTLGAELVALEGAWSGTYTNTRTVNGCTFNNTGNLDATAKTTGATVSSSETVTGLEIRNANGCAVVTKVNGTAPLSDFTISGNTLTGTWNITAAGYGALPFPFTATVSGKTITGTWTCSTCTGGFTLTKP